MAQCLKISLFSLLLLNGCLKMEKTVQRIFSDVVNAINDESTFVGKLFGKIEQKSGRSRYQAAIFLACVICILVAVYNPAVKLLCDLICIVYPAMKTLAEIESIEKSKCKQWLFYWIIFGLFTIVDLLADCTALFISIYWLPKCVFFLMLFMPSCLGAEILYEKFFQSRYSQYISGCSTAVEMTTE
ncbi:Receptor expression-enhancing protein 5 [Trichinella pseudospiralis]|uniref:Receptor expression-enhancing protein n=1 Tax=Trichinella pseudospiralis TaxID=6337 RepID=A0A0V1ERQ0_TRIPS|nr:Receptor expression-enhancing protein 5 [Trichinella pseudospiralis]KRY76182.1 Receptor expression-enhancing protein 5 [Trichinella pseudospiralis]KRY76379.1 Receptor expression-enhancing protein 5 [Trichinella pseudospiralis]KRY91214.1 Receptor expression-enhancing protein 5 [Trichinella pseudospiralis]KRY91269.1 Receptor expression-enhancing protein 5 [Trichinella pseudospiralis]